MIEITFSHAFRSVVCMNYFLLHNLQETGEERHPVGRSKHVNRDSILAVYMPCQYFCQKHIMEEPERLLLYIGTRNV